MNERFEPKFEKMNGNRFFVQFSASEDSVSEGVRDSLNRFRSRFGQYIDSRNAPLFVYRVQNAVSLIRYAIGEQIEKDREQSKERKASKAGAASSINRETFLDYFGGVAEKCIETDYDLIEFDENFIQRKEVNFVRYQDGEANTHLEQLNTRGFKIPNIRMGIQITNIFDIDVRKGEFGADFFYWTEAHKDEELTTKSVIFKNLKELSFKDQPVEIPKGEEVYKLYRLSGRFYMQFNIKDYPLDQQHLRLEAEVINPSELVRLSFDRESLRQAQVASGAVKVDQWNIKDFYVTVDNKLSESLYGRNFSRECSQKFKHLTTHIVIKRNFLDSFLTVILPLILIGFIAIANLWVKGQSFQAVGNVAVGIFLGLIAFLIALTDIAPDMSQISRAGVLFWSTFIVVVSVILVLVAVNSRFGSNRLRARIVRFAQLAIPSLYILSILLIPLL